MIIYYLDSSAWVKKYFQEVGTSWIVKFFDNDEEREIASSTLGIIEVLATITRKHKTEKFDPTSLKEKLEEAESDWENFSQIQLTTEIVDESKRAAQQLALRGADAVHFASAFLLRQDPIHEDDQVVFIVSDKELKAAARAADFTVIDPAEQE